MEQLLEKHGLQRLGPVLARHALPSIAFSLTGAPTTRCAFGGAPFVPREFEWPTYMPAPVSYPPAVLARLGLAAAGPPTRRALDFLLQIDLSVVCHLSPAVELPRNGLLTFFYDAENQPWGYDPARLDGFRVCLFDDIDLVSRMPPARALPRRGMTFSQGSTLPHFGSRAHDELAAQAELPEAYFDLA